MGNHQNEFVETRMNQTPGAASEPALLTPTVAETALTYLASVQTLVPGLTRAVLFAAPTPDALSPVATLAADERRPGFHIIKDLLKTTYRDGVRRRQVVEERGASRLVVVLLVPVGTSIPGRANSNQPAEQRLILHAEFDDAAAAAGSGAEARLEVAARLGAPALSAAVISQEIDRWVMGMTKVIIATVEAKDTYTSGHSERVSRYSLALAEECGLTAVEKYGLQLSALWHDIGKIGVPDAILKKPGMLSAGEFDEMKAHPTIGASIIMQAPHALAVLDGVKFHHERFDGTGYPDGLAGDGIPLFARIIAIADAFDAMTSGRTYTAYMTQAEAVESLVGKTDLFDPDLLQALAKAFGRGTVSMRTGTRVHNLAAS